MNNLPDLLSSLALLAVILIVAGWTYHLWSNDWAASTVDTKLLEIDRFLAQFDLSVYEVPLGDGSPCDARFSVIDGARAGIPPQRFWLLLKDAKRLHNVHRLLCACQAAETAHHTKIAKQTSF